MGVAELDRNNHLLNIHASLIFYGNAASNFLAKQVAEDVAIHWNEPQATVKIANEWYRVHFLIRGFYEPALTELDV